MQIYIKYMEVTRYLIFSRAKSCIQPTWMRNLFYIMFLFVPFDVWSWKRIVNSSNNVRKYMYLQKMRHILPGNTAVVFHASAPSAKRWTHTRMCGSVIAFPHKISNSTGQLQHAISENVSLKGFGNAQTEPRKHKNEKYINPREAQIGIKLVQSKYPLIWFIGVYSAF